MKSNQVADQLKSLPLIRESFKDKELNELLSAAMRESDKDAEESPFQALVACCQEIRLALESLQADKLRSCKTSLSVSFKSISTFLVKVLTQV